MNQRPPDGQPPYRQPQWGQLQPPYRQPTPSNTALPHSYRGWVLAELVLGYLAALGLLFLEIAVTSGVNTTAEAASSPTGILSTASVVLLLVIHSCILLLDGRSFFTLFGRLQWKKLPGWQRVGFVLAYLCLLVMPAIYLVFATHSFLRGRQQTLSQALQSGWTLYRSKPRKTQMTLGVVVCVLLASFITFASVAAMVDRANALSLATPPAAPRLIGGATPTVFSTPTQESVAVQTTATTMPTATHPIKPAPTVVPTQAPQPTQASASPTPCPGINCNPWGYNFVPGNLIYSPPSDFCAYFSCIDSFWNGRGFVNECNDGMYSKSGAIRGDCSHHSGEQRPLYSH